MKKNLLLLLMMFLSGIDLIAQDCSTTPPSDGQMYPWCYQRNNGTKWDTTPYKAFIINGLPFRLLYPLDYEASAGTGKKYPLVVVLHGIGENGTDNNSQLKYGGINHLNAVKNGVYHGFIMMPHSPTDLWGSGSRNAILKFVEYAINNLRVDDFRVQVEGYSGGGTAAWQLAYENPKVFAAAIPMSSANGSTANAYAQTLKYTAVWHSQGGRDTRPAPSAGNTVAAAFKNAGANYKYQYYHELGHGTWGAMYVEPGFFEFMNRNSQLNIHALNFKSNFCNGEAVSGTMGVTAGFEGYEWQKDGAPVGGNTHEIQFSALGSYTVRIKHKGVWSKWSDPLVIKFVGPTATPTITASGPTALPSLDGRTSVTLRAPKGFQDYKWSNNATTDSIIVEKAGTYSVTVTESLGCPSASSAPITVTYNAVGVLPAPTNMSVLSTSPSELTVRWTDNSSDETGFEIYRSIMPDGPWVLAGQVASNATSFIDGGLEAYTRYFYSMRAVSNKGGSTYINADGKTKADVVVPTAPTNLEAYYTSRKGVYLRWNPSQDNAAGTLTYEIYINNQTTLAATTTDTEIKVTGLEERQLYNFAVRAKDNAGNYSAFSNQVAAATIVNGLLYTYYEGEMNSVYEMSGLDPIRKNVTPNANIKLASVKDRYGFKFFGYINIPTTGNYTFYTTSDDGSIMVINGQEVVNNDKNHAPQEKSGSIQLSAGFHEIVILYYDKAGNTDVLKLEWQGPGISRQVIPDAAFKEDFSAPPAPAAPSDVTASAVDHQSILIKWQDKSNNETGFELYRSTSNTGPFTFIKSVGANIIEYTDVNLQPNTRYYYQLKSVNGSGSSPLAPKGTDGMWANATTKEGTNSSAPASPTDLTATLTNNSSATLGWKDNSTNEDGFEIYRNGELIITVAANTTSYINQGINSSNLYTYQVRARNSAGTSAFSNEASVGSGTNKAPVLAPIGTVYAPINASATVDLSASDPENTAISFTGTNLPEFAELIDNNDGTASLIISAGEEQAGTYSDVIIRATDNGGATDAETISIVVSNNQAPGIMEIFPVSIQEKESHSIDVRAYDGNGDKLVLTLEGAPAFAGITDKGNNTGTILLTPGYAHAGEYLLSVKATDPKGLSTTTSFTVTVSDIVTDYKVMLNFNDHFHAQAPAPWNNFARYPSAGTTVNNLKDAEQRITPIDVSILDNFGRSDDGATTGSYAGLYPDPVLKTYYYGWDDTPRHIKISGLDDELTYSLAITGSSDQANAGSTAYTVNGVSASIDVSNNTKAAVTFKDLKATNGELIIAVKRTAEEQLAYINALVIEARYEDTSAPHAPSELQVTVTTGANLAWKDNAYNEAGFEIFRGTDGTNFTKIGAVAANIVAYADNTITAGGLYYYQVRANNTNGFSGWSNTVQIGNKTPDPDPDPDNPDDPEEPIDPDPNNNPPIIAGFPTVVSAKEGTTTTIEFTLYDPEGAPLTLITKNLPAFATIAQGSNNTGTITLNPTVADLGVYNGIQFTATDGVKEADVVFRIVVSNSQKKSTYVNVGNQSTAPLPWNNINKWAGTNNLLIKDLKDEFGNVTGYSIVATTPFSRSAYYGATAGANYGVYPDEVLRSGYMIEPGKTASFKVTGLKPNLRYNFVFMGSSINKSFNGTTSYSAGGQKVSIPVQSNVSKTMQINGLQASASGEIVVTVTGEADATKGGYLNAFVIEEYEDNGELMRPGRLDAYAVSDIKAPPMIEVSWTDNSYQESGFEVWRRTLPSGSFTRIAVTAANITSYTDTNLPENTGYEYKVRAVNGAKASEYSDLAQAATLLYEVYVNMNNGFRGTTPPWNNLDRKPITGDSWYNFKTDKGIGTFINMRIEESFDGGNAYGPNAKGQGIYEDNVIRYFYFTEVGVVAKVRLFGLNDELIYNFRFFAASAFEGGESGVTEYRIGNKKAMLDVERNIKNTTVIRDVRSVNGNVYLEIEAADFARYGFLNAMVIEARDDSKEISQTMSAGKVAGAVETQSVKQENQIAKLYPNPTKGEFYVEFSAKSKGHHTIQVTDMQGRLIHTQEVLAHEGANTFIVDLRNPTISAGMYILKIKSMDFESKVIRFMKQ